MSQTSNLDFSRQSYYNRHIGGKSLGTAIRQDPAGNDHDGIDVNEQPTPRKEDANSDIAAHSKTYTQRLQDQISSSANRPKASDLAAKWKEQEERDAQRKREAKPEIERKRAAEEEERGQEQQDAGEESPKAQQQQRALLSIPTKEAKRMRISEEFDKDIDIMDSHRGPAPLNLDEMFSKTKDRWHKFRTRTSSANWSGTDRLTEEDVRKDLAARDKMRREGGWPYELSRAMS